MVCRPAGTEGPAREWRCVSQPSQGLDTFSCKQPSREPHPQVNTKVRAYQISQREML